MCVHLQAALKKVLGDDVTQQGSIVRQDGFRFDFSLPRPMKAKEVEEDRAYCQSVDRGAFKPALLLRTRPRLHT